MRKSTLALVLAMVAGAASSITCGGSSDTTPLVGSSAGSGGAAAGSTSGTGSASGSGVTGTGGGETGAGGASGTTATGAGGASSTTTTTGSTSTTTGAGGGNCGSSPTCGAEMPASGCVGCALAGPCASEEAACKADPDCKAFQTCIAACQPDDGSCIVPCVTGHMQGKNEASKLEHCIQCDTCSVVCKTDPATCS